MDWIDNHCHLDGSDQPDALIAEAEEAGVRKLICVGVDLERSKACVGLAAEYAQVFATVGVHPHDASGGTDGVAKLLRSGLEDSTVVAVGECGLDYFYEHSPRDSQREVFAEQIGLANELECPLVIHTREAWEDTFEILDAEGTPKRTVFHCFTGGAAEAEECVKRGAMLSISGIVTFPSANNVREAVVATGLERLMVETDSPYLAPVPHRGKPNRPALVAHVGQSVADCLGVEVGAVAQATTQNAMEFYGLPT